MLGASLAGEKVNSRPSASRVSPRRIRRTTSLLRPLDQRPLLMRTALAASVGLRPPRATSPLVHEKRGFFMPDIVFKSPKSVCQQIVHQTTWLRTPVARSKCSTCERRRSALRTPQERLRNLWPSASNFGNWDEHRAPSQLGRHPRLDYATPIPLRTHEVLE